MAFQKLNGAILSRIFVDYIEKRASCHARPLVACGFYKWSEREDLKQDLLLDLLQRLPRFDESRGDLYAFAFSVIRNRASVLATRRSKWYDRETVPLDSVLEGGDVGAAFGAQFRDPRVEDFFRASDIRRAVDHLPSRLKGLARDLESMTVPEICVRMGKSRSRVYQMMGEIRGSLIE
jgi:RNA polymerase sigma factor (sigma-70 family)